MRRWILLALGISLFACGKKEEIVQPTPVDADVKVFSKIGYYRYDTVREHRIYLLGADMHSPAHGTINGITIPPDSFRWAELVVGLSAYIEDSTLSVGDTISVELNFDALAGTPVHATSQNVLLPPTDTVFFVHNNDTFNIIWEPVEGADVYRFYFSSNCQDTSYRYWYYQSTIYTTSSGVSVPDSLICPYDTINSGSLRITVSVYNGPWNSSEGNMDGATGRFFTITAREFQYSLPLR